MKILSSSLLLLLSMTMSVSVESASSIGPKSLASKPVRRHVTGNMNKLPASPLSSQSFEYDDEHEDEHEDEEIQGKF